MNTPPSILDYSQQTGVDIKLTPAFPKNYYRS